MATDLSTRAGPKQPARARSAQPRPAQHRPAQPRSAQFKSAQLKPAQLKPAQLKPAQLKPAQPRPAKSNLVQTPPAQQRARRADGPAARVTTRSQPGQQRPLRQPDTSAPKRLRRAAEPTSRRLRAEPEPTPRQLRREAEALQERPRPQGAADRDGLAAQWTRSSGLPRTAFVLLVLGLLGCALVFLLVTYTTLAKSSYQINDLQGQNAKLAQQAQSLQQQVSAEQSPGSIARRAYQLGMREQAVLRFIDLRTGKTFRQPADIAGLPSSLQAPTPPPKHARRAAPKPQATHGRAPKPAGHGKPAKRGSR
jgi:hypothetical protein